MKYKLITIGGMFTMAAISGMKACFIPAIIGSILVISKKED